MKSILIIILPVMFMQQISAQDIITTKEKKQLTVRVVEQTDKYVKYKMPDYEDGPVLMLKTNRITRIEYRNGYVDMMGYQNPRKDKPLGINAGYAASLSGGGDMVLATLDYFVIPQIDLEVNFGTSDLSGGLYYSAGGRFHLNSKYSEHKLTPFAGALFGSYYGDELILLPAGVNYLSRIGLNASLSINQLITFNSWQATLMELRLGWRF